MDSRRVGQPAITHLAQTDACVPRRRASPWRRAPAQPGRGGRARTSRGARGWTVELELGHGAENEALPWKCHGTELVRNRRESLCLSNAQFPPPPNFPLPAMADATLDFLGHTPDIIVP